MTQPNNSLQNTGAFQRIDLSSIIFCVKFGCNMSSLDHKGVQ